MQESPVSLQHFEKLMGPYGLYQHADKQEPNLEEGYCVDDNARAVMVLLAYMKKFPTERTRAQLLLESCWKFITDARHAAGTYYNFRNASGRWLMHDISEDMYARLARTYAYVLAHDEDSTRKNKATELLIDLIPRLKSLTAPRAQAETIIAVATIPQHSIENYPEFRTIQTDHTNNLLDLWNRESSDTWPWFEQRMTYANALLPYSILASGQDVAHEYLHVSAAFLISSTIQNNIFMPIGNRGWYQKGGIAATYDQQPIEAGTMLDFLLAYKETFPEKVSQNTLQAPYLWFFGKNTKNTILANKQIGACLDGLNADKPNCNYGAESMLAYLWAELIMPDRLKA